MYLLSGLYGLAFGVGEALQAYIRDPVPFYLLGRMATATFGTATIAGLYVLAAGAYGRSTALLASLFLAVNLLHVRESHFITTDVPLTFLVTLALVFILRYWRAGRLRDAVGSGLVAGLAASMKYPGGLALLPFFVAHLLRAGPGPASGWRRLVGREPGLAVGAAAAGFALGTPYAVLTPGAFWRGVMSEVREVGSVQFGNEGALPGYLFHLVHSLPEAMGLPLLGLALGGLGWALYARAPRELVLLAFPLPYFLLIGSWSARFERYALPLLPFLALWAALALVALAGRLRQGGPRLAARWRPGLGLALAAGLLVAPEVARITYFHVLLTRADTRVLAGEWIERHIPPGARIAMEPYSPAVRLDPAMVREAREQLGEGLGAMVLRPRIDRFLAGPLGGEAAGYRIFRLTAYDLDRLLEQGIEVVVLSGFIYQRYQQACDRYPAPCRFYEELERRATPLVAIEPGLGGRALSVGDIYAPLTRLLERTHPGPSIRIYRLPRS
ncbi:MAG: glycosyltransferase family 39 protein [Candidatus Rokubacteria bacterium]|nr:glycosyltransferase family 39 protein [Candidatus Rokubacteria bacterium]